MLVNSGAEALTSITKHFESELEIKAQQNWEVKIVFAPTFESVGMDHFPKIKDHYPLLDFDSLIKEEIAK